jgi:hypothetical protein
MVTVYFESKNGSYAEVVAKFQDEDLYFACLSQLEVLAEKEGFDCVTESVDGEEL